jgi:hypothetical protein
MAKLPSDGYKPLVRDAWKAHAAGFTLDLAGGRPVIQTLNSDGSVHKTYIVAAAPSVPCTNARCIKDAVAGAPATDCACITIRTESFLGPSFHPLIFKADAAAAAFATLAHDFEVTQAAAAAGWPTMAAYHTAMPRGDLLGSRGLYDPTGPWPMPALDPFSVTHVAVTANGGTNTAFLHASCVGMLSAVVHYKLEPILLGLVLVALEAPANLPPNDVRLVMASGVVTAGAAPAPHITAPQAAAANVVLAALQNPARTAATKWFICSGPSDDGCTASNAS